MRNAAFFLVIAILAALGGVARLVLVDRSGALSESTDDAYVHADTSVISPKIDGYIEQVRVRENEAVAAGARHVRRRRSRFRGKSGAGRGRGRDRGGDRRRLMPIASNFSGR